MANDPGKDKRYHQSPRAFRKQLRRSFKQHWEWLFDHSQETPKGSELCNFIAHLSHPFVTQLSRLSTRTYHSRTFKRVMVVVVVSAIGVLLQSVPEKRNTSSTLNQANIISVAKILFDHLESIALGSAGTIFLIETKERQKKELYEAWQVINSAMGQTAGGGRRQALEDLVRDGVNLEGVAIENADLSGINLSFSQLERANLSKTRLNSAILRGANLQGAQLEKTDLTSANLERANLTRANLAGAYLRKADLRKARLQDASLQSAYLTEARMQGADLIAARAQGAYLTNSKMQGVFMMDAFMVGANLTGSQLQGANLRQANLTG